MSPFVLLTGFAKKCLIDYAPTFGDSFKRGKVVNVNPVAKTVTLHNGEKLEYDELVLATGTGGPFPAKLPLDIDKTRAIERYDGLAGLVSIVRKQHYCVQLDTPIYTWKGETFWSARVFKSHLNIENLKTIVKENVLVSLSNKSCFGLEWSFTKKKKKKPPCPT